MATQKTILDIIKQEHDEVKKIMDELVNTTSRAQQKRTDGFQRLVRGLDPHMAAEEEVFYPALQGHKEASDIVFEAYDEHRIAKMVRQELGSMDVQDERWTARMKVFKELIEHHIEDEESDVFSAAKKFLDQNQLQSVTEKYQSAEQRARGGMSMQRGMSS